MVILIGGTSHTGKTALAQRLLEKYHYPYLSIDHLKMGLIRSKQTTLTPMDDDKLTEYLWPIVREIIKTAIENQQNLIVEGCYIPFHWQQDFDATYLQHIRYFCLIMSRQYIENYFADILHHANAIEARLDDSDLTADALIQENAHHLEQCLTHHCPYIWIDGDYESSLSKGLEQIRILLEETHMEVKIMELPAFTVVGISRTFQPETSYQKIPAFWQEMMQQPDFPLLGMYGICNDEAGAGKEFDYWIADNYDPQKPIAAGFSTLTIPGGTWAVFPCTLETLQDTNTKMWNEWLPKAKEYQLRRNLNVEMYMPDGYVELWLPVTKI